MRQLHARGAMRSVLIGGAALVLAAAPAGAQQSFADVAGWSTTHIALAELREMGSEPAGPDMNRRAGDTRV